MCWQESERALLVADNEELMSKISVLSGKLRSLEIERDDLEEELRSERDRADSVAIEFEAEKSARAKEIEQLRQDELDLQV